MENRKPETENVNPMLSGPRPGGMRGDELADRMVRFAVRVLKIADALPKTVTGRHLADQLIRAGTSAGAHYEEARGAQSKRDFAYKLAIGLKELQETRYWLRLIALSGLIGERRLAEVVREVDELCRILGTSLKTVRGRSDE